jgi:hypothetical protein
MWDSRNDYESLVSKPNGRDHLEGLAIVGKIILKLILHKLGGSGFGSSGSGWELVVITCKHGNEPLVCCIRFIIS